VIVDAGDEEGRAGRKRQRPESMADTMEVDGGGGESAAAAAAVAEGVAAAASGASPGKGSAIESHAPQTSGESAKGGAKEEKEKDGEADGERDGGARSGRPPSPAGAAAGFGSAAADAEQTGTDLAAEDPKQQKAGKQPGKFMAQVCAHVAELPGARAFDRLRAG